MRSESPSNVQAAKLIAEMAAEIGVEFNVQVVSTDKLYELTVRKVDGKPAPEFDTFIWGWGGDPYDPSFLLSLLTTEQIGGSSDSFYSNPEYDRLFEQQAGDVRRRGAQGADPADGRDHAGDLPYLVLTEDPNLEAYRTDRLANVEPVVPGRRPATCSASRSPTSRCSRSRRATALRRRGAAAAPTGLIVVVGGAGPRRRRLLFVRARAAAGREPLELEE